MPTPLLICVKALVGGLFVTGFAVLGEMLQPKRFAGIFGASPAVALADLLVVALAKGGSMARDAATGMIAGAIALAIACGAAVPAVRRWGAARASGVLWAAGSSSAARPASRSRARLPDPGPACRQAARPHDGGSTGAGRRPARTRTGSSPSTSTPCGRSARAPSPCVSPSGRASPWWPGWSGSWPGSAQAA